MKNFAQFNESVYSQQIKSTTDINYLKELEKYIDLDIANVGKDSDAIKNIKAKMIKMSVEDMDKQQLLKLNDLKTSIQQRITELSK